MPTSNPTEVNSRALKTVEWPTIALIVATYAAWFGVTAVAATHPIVLLAGGFIVCLHGSLQHEATHRHPTRSDMVNALLVGAPLGLWLPFTLYRESHIEHHASPSLTDPDHDPESFYMTQRQWASASNFRRALARTQNTLAGRLLFGPFIVIARTWSSEARRVFGGDWRRARVWFLHAVLSAGVLAWVVLICGIHPAIYIGTFVYAGLSLTLLRSFAEHQPAPDHHHRSVVVDAHPLWSLLFLNNNLHAVHHAEPWRPWYQLPARYRARRHTILAQNGGYHFAGYGEIARRYALRAKDSPELPRC